jgi:hypothetical protein
MQNWRADAPCWFAVQRPWSLPLLRCQRRSELRLHDFLLSVGRCDLAVSHLGEQLGGPRSQVIALKTFFGFLFWRCLGMSPSENLAAQTYTIGNANQFLFVPTLELLRKQCVLSFAGFQGSAITLPHRTSREL